MATWKLSNYYKKNAVERQYWRKDGKLIIREEGYRWGTWYCESDERPDVDLKNDDGWEPYSDDVEWEMDSMDDGCWVDITYPDDMSEEEREEWETAWDEDGFEGLEELGWTNDDTDLILYGPLQLINEDTGEEWNGDQVESEGGEAD